MGSLGPKQDLTDINIPDVEMCWLFHTFTDFTVWRIVSLAAPYLCIFQVINYLFGKPLILSLTSYTVSAHCFCKTVHKPKLINLHSCHNGATEMSQITLDKVSTYWKWIQVSVQGHLEQPQKWFMKAQKEWLFNAHWLFSFKQAVLKPAAQISLAFISRTMDKPS